MPGKIFSAVVMLAITSPVFAGDLRAFCADRPGLGTPACTVDQGHAVAEVGIADWTRDEQGAVRTDSLMFGEALLRFGLTDTLEAQVGWNAFGQVQVRDDAVGSSTRSSRFGDVTLAIRQNLQHPDGSGTSVALMPYVHLPAGRDPVGGGDWGTGLLVPISFDLGATSLAFTPEIDAAADGDGSGRHLGYGTVVGLGFNLSSSVSAATELSGYRDRDPAGVTTTALAGLSLGWQSNSDSQWDAGVNLGLNRDSPDTELYWGYARRF